MASQKKLRYKGPYSCSKSKRNIFSRVHAAGNAKAQRRHIIKAKQRDNAHHPATQERVLAMLLFSLRNYFGEHFPPDVVLTHPDTPLCFAIPPKPPFLPPDLIQL